MGGAVAGLTALGVVAAVEAVEDPVTAAGAGGAGGGRSGGGQSERVTPQIARIPPALHQGGPEPLRHGVEPRRVVHL